MSAYTNGLALWKHFEEKQGAIIYCLKAEQYEELNELILDLDNVFFVFNVFMILLR